MILERRRLRSVAKNRSTIGQLLEAARANKGQDLTAASQECGVSRQQFTNWERDLEVPSRDESILAVAAYLDISLEEFGPVLGESARIRSEARVSALQQRVERRGR